RLPGASEGAPRRAARAVRGVDGAPRRGPPGRVRGGRRLSPGAGASIPQGAGRRRRSDGAHRRARRRAPRVGRAPGADAWRHGGRRQPARARGLPRPSGWSRSRYAAVDEALERAIEHARKAGAGWEEAESLGLYTGSGVFGPAPVPEVIERSERILREAKGNRLVEARAFRSLAALRAMEG